MPETNNCQKRYSDNAKELGINEKIIFAHDVNGSVLRIIELLNNGKSLEEAKKLIGTRKNDETEHCLGIFSEFILLNSLQEWLNQNKEISKSFVQSFKLNTEQIRLALVDGICEKELSDRLDGLDFAEFNALIIGIRKKQQLILEKYRKQLQQ